jgi:hypothetical protein
MKLNKNIMAVDAETPTLMGGNQPLAIAAVLYSPYGEALSEFCGRIDLTKEVLEKQDAWIMENVIPEIIEISNVYADESHLMSEFAKWYLANKENSIVVAHMCNPVETHLFIEMYKQGFIGMWEQPTFYDVATVLWMKGEDPWSVDNYNAKHQLDLSEVAGLRPHHPMYDVMATWKCLSHMMREDVELPQTADLPMIKV